MEATCSLAGLASAVLTAAERVLEEYGLEGYRKEWIEHDFPVRKYQELKQLLSNRRF